VLLLGELVKDLEGAVAMVDHLQVVRQLMGIQDPADELHINRVILHDEDRQWWLGSRTLHTRGSSMRAARASHTSPDVGAAPGDIPCHNSATRRPCDGPLRRIP
jgi:hypothetical protein